MNSSNSSGKTSNQASPPNDPVALVQQRQIESYEAGALNMWTVYDKPRDYPNLTVARRFVVNRRHGSQPTADIIGGGLEDIRRVFTQAGLTCLPRKKEDEPQIVEVWL